MLLTLGILLTAAASASTLPAELSQKIDHFAQAHQRSRKALAAFDRELDEALATQRSGLLLRSSGYRQLLALRVLKHSDAHAVAERIESLRASNPAGALALEKQLELKLSSLAKNDPESASAFVAEISSHHEGLSLPENLKGLAKAPFGRERPRPAKLALLPGLLDLEIAEITSKLAIPDESGNPKIRPGTGTEGNITGGSFPLNTWALTFDDGPHPKYTQIALDTLGAHRQKATFFWLAENVAKEKNQAAISAARRAGMSLNNHSFTHADLNKAGAAQLDHEINDSSQLESRVYGSRPDFFRLPYGSGVRNKNVRQLIADAKMIHVFWNVDSLDWQDKDPAKILARVKKQMLLEKRGVILFHDIHPQSVEAAKLLLDYSDSLNNTKRAIRWVTLPEIRDELNQSK